MKWHRLSPSFWALKATRIGSERSKFQLAMFWLFLWLLHYEVRLKKFLKNDAPGSREDGQG